LRCLSSSPRSRRASARRSTSTTTPPKAFYVVEGEYHIFLPSGEVRCPAGAFIFIPAGVEHGFRVGAAPSRKLNIYVPAAMIGYFDEVAAGGLDDAALSALAAKYSMEVTGPVPEGYI
jgi:hypothetical protein